MIAQCMEKRVRELGEQGVAIDLAMLGPGSVCSHLADQVFQTRGACSDSPCERGMNDVRVLPLVSDPKGLGKAACSWILKEDGNRERVNGTRPLGRRCWMIRNSLRELCHCCARECEQLDSRRWVLRDESVWQGYERRTFPCSWTCEDTSMTVMIVPQYCGLLLRRLVRHLPLPFQIADH